MVKHCRVDKTFQPTFLRSVVGEWLETLQVGGKHGQGPRTALARELQHRLEARTTHQRGTVCVTLATSAMGGAHDKPNSRVDRSPKTYGRWCRTGSVFHRRWKRNVSGHRRLLSQPRRPHVFLCERSPCVLGRLVGLRHSKPPPQPVEAARDARTRANAHSKQGP